MKRKTSLTITRDYDGTCLVETRFSDEDLLRERAEVLTELLDQLRFIPGYRDAKLPFQKYP